MITNCYKALDYPLKACNIGFIRGDEPMPSLIMPMITACVMLGGTHEIRCVESTPPSNFVAEHVLKEMHRRRPNDTFWFVLTKPKGA